MVSFEFSYLQFQVEFLLWNGIDFGLARSSGTHGWCRQELFWWVSDLVPKRRNSSVLAMELHFSCTNPSISSLWYHWSNWCVKAWTNGHDFEESSSNASYFKENFCILIILLNFGPMGPIDNKVALSRVNNLVPQRCQAIAWFNVDQYHDTIWHHQASMSYRQTSNIRHPSTQ